MKRPAGRGYYRRMDASRSGGFAGHRRDRTAGRLVYPVLSRRSGGLSLGVNLFPDAKRCSFDCPYCEVFPHPGLGAGGPFDEVELEAELGAFLDRGYAEAWAPEPIRDLCLSGDGEPSLSPRLGPALEVLARARRLRPGLLGRTDLVLITNSTGFLLPETAALLGRAVDEEGLVVWAKLDSGDEEGFRRMSRSSHRLSEIVSGIASFASEHPLVIQTMLCEVEGAAPGEDALRDYAGLLARLAAGGARVSAVHLYTKARPSPEGGTAPIADAPLAAAARLVASRVPFPVRAFGAAGEIALA